MIHEIIILFLIYFFSSISIYGWGLFTSLHLGLQLNKENSSQIFFVGLSTVILVTQIIYLFLPIDWKISSSVFLMGFLFLCKFSNVNLSIKFNEILNFIKTCPLICLGTVALILGYSTRLTEQAGHADAGLYHLPIINWLNQFSIVPGLGNLHFRLAFNQSYFHLAALLNFYPLWDHGYQSTNFLIFIATIFSTYQLINSLNDHKFPILLLLSIIFIVVLQDPISAAPDFTVCLYQLNIFLLAFKLFIKNKNTQQQNLQDIIYLIILCTTCITLKLSSIVFCTVCILIILKNYILLVKHNYIYLYKGLIFCILILFLSVFTGYILSGYLFYPSTFTGGLNPEWAIPPANVIKEQAWIFSWARNPNLLPQEVLGNWNWLSPWISNLTSKVWFPLSLGTLVILIYYFSSKFKPYFSNVNSKLFILYLPLFLSLIFWFFTAPDPRFIGAVPGLYLFISCFIFYLNFDHKKFLSIFLTKLILFIFFILFFILSLMYSFGLGTGFGIVKYLHISSIITAASEVGINQKLVQAFLLIILYIFLKKFFVIKNSLFVKVFSFSFFCLVIASLYNYMNINPSLSLGWSTHPIVETNTLTTHYGLEIKVPKINDRCWTSTLPCTPYFDDNLKFSEVSIFSNIFIKNGFTTSFQK